MYRVPNQPVLHRSFIKSAVPVLGEGLPVHGGAEWLTWRLCRLTVRLFPGVVINESRRRDTRLITVTPAAEKFPRRNKKKCLVMKKNIVRGQFNETYT